MPMPMSAASASRSAPSSGVRSARMKPDTPASPSRAQHGGAAPTAEDLVDVAHGHQRDVRPGGVDAADELDGVVEARAVAQRDRAGALERGAVRERVRVGQPDLEQVGAGVDERERDVERAWPRPGSRPRRTG